MKGTVTFLGIMPGHISTCISHPLEEKLLALHMLEDGSKVRVVCAKLKIKASTLSRWKRDKEKYFARESQGMNPKIKRLRRGKMHNVEVATIKWFRQADSRDWIDGPMLACVAER